MKTAEFYNEQFFTNDNLDLVDLIGDIQKEAYKQGVVDALENTEKAKKKVK